MLASHWVVEKLLKAFDSKNLGVIRETSKKFSKRYPEDLELQAIYKKTKDYLKKPSNAKLNAIKSELKELINIRKLESSGGTGLWFEDRRARKEQRIR